jgi:hypothetical protein
MSRTSRRAAAAVAALALTGLGVALVADPGRAQDPSHTITVTYGKDVGAVSDVAPKGLGRGVGSLGDQFFVNTAVRRDDGTRGRLQVTYVVGQKRVALGRSRGLMSGAYRFPDGALFVMADITFDDADKDTGAIVGGTGAYAGARGTVESDKTHDVIHLEP